MNYRLFLIALGIGVFGLSPTSLIAKDNVSSPSTTLTNQSPDDKATHTNQIANNETGSQQTGVVVTNYNIPHIDTKTIQSTWLTWLNTARKKVGSDEYILDEKLVSTATEWAQVLAKENRTSKTHRRPGQSCTNGRCYDYNTMLKWRSDRGIQETTISESVARNTYSCKSDDCTDKLTERIKKGFNFFMSEAKSNGPHYKTVVSNKYTKVGLGLAVANGRYYLVMHVSK